MFYDEQWVDWTPDFEPPETDPLFRSSTRDAIYYSHVPTFADYHRNVWITINFVVSYVASLLLFIANLVIAIGGKKVADAVNVAGPALGVKASLGAPYQGLVWAAWAGMVLNAAYWFWMYVTRGLLLDARESCRKVCKLFWTRNISPKTDHGKALKQEIMRKIEEKFDAKRERKGFKPYLDSRPSWVRYDKPLFVTHQTGPVGFSGKTIIKEKMLG